jgi:hypothetical protein
MLSPCAAVQHIINLNWGGFKPAALKAMLVRLPLTLMAWGSEFCAVVESIRAWFLAEKCAPFADVACRCTKTHCWQVLRERSTDCDHGRTTNTLDVLTEPESGVCQACRCSSSSTSSSWGSSSVTVLRGRVDFGTKMHIDQCGSVYEASRKGNFHEVRKVAGGFARFLVRSSSSVNGRLTRKRLTWKLVYTSEQSQQSRCIVVAHTKHQYSARFTVAAV